MLLVSKYPRSQELHVLSPTLHFIDTEQMIDLSCCLFSCQPLIYSFILRYMPLRKNYSFWFLPFPPSNLFLPRHVQILYWWIRNGGGNRVEVRDRDHCLKALLKEIFCPGLSCSWHKQSASQYGDGMNGVKTFLPYVR